MSVGVGIGISELPFERARGFWRWVEMCEESTVDSIWQTDRLITDNPMLESLTTMAAVAGATERLKFGMNVVALGWRDPLVVAKQCASIDFLSEGRLLPAFGIGTPRGEEWRATGRDTRSRGARTDEALDIISRLWAGETVDYDGEYYQYRGARISPLPVQKRLPLWIGGDSKAAIRRTARIGTGWLAGFQSPDEVTPVVAAIKVAAREAGTSHPRRSLRGRLPLPFWLLERCSRDAPGRDHRQTERAETRGLHGRRRCRRHGGETQTIRRRRGLEIRAAAGRDRRRRYPRSDPSPDRRGAARCARPQRVRAGLAALIAGVLA